MHGGNGNGMQQGPFAGKPGVLETDVSKTSLSPSA